MFSGCFLAKCVYVSQRFSRHWFPEVPDLVLEICGTKWSVWVEIRLDLSPNATRKDELGVGNGDLACMSCVNTLNCCRHQALLEVLCYTNGTNNRCLRRHCTFLSHSLGFWSLPFESLSKIYQLGCSLILSCPEFVGPLHQERKPCVAKTLYPFWSLLSECQIPVKRVRWH